MISIKHRWYFLSALLCLVLFHPSTASNCGERPVSNTVLFATKVQESPIILIGTSMNKLIDPNVPNLFNVSFLVECILKGRPTQRLIQIVQAGSLLGRRSCQQLDPNRQYIVFLEEFFDGTYRPVDFEEVPYSNQLNIVLEKTCGLSRTYPFTDPDDKEAGVTNRCPPAVSVDCPKEAPKPADPWTTTFTLPQKLIKQKATTSTASTPRSTSTNVNIFRAGGIDLALLSQFLAEHPQNNFSLGFLQNQPHKTLFSDDDVRKNGAEHVTFFIPAFLFIAYSMLFCRSY